MRESSLESLLLLAALYVMHEKHAKARTLLEGLRELAPQEERVLRPLCHVLAVQKEYAQALEAAQELLGLVGKTLSGTELACLLRLKASALWGLGRVEEARAALEQGNAALAGPMPENTEVPKRRGLFR